MMFVKIMAFFSYYGTQRKVAALRTYLEEKPWNTATILCLMFGFVLYIGLAIGLTVFLISFHRLS